MRVIGITGSSGSGKTTVCEIIKKLYNSEVLDADKVAKELLELSKQYMIYGLCDESLILCEGKTRIFLGEVYQIIDGTVKRISV